MTVIPLCFDCRRYDRAAPPGTSRCKAFPVDIPVEILAVDHDHRKPYPGDSGIRFEPISDRRD